MGEWARQLGLFKLRDTDVAYGVRGLNHYVYFSILFVRGEINYSDLLNNMTCYNIRMHNTLPYNAYQGDIERLRLI